MKGELYGKTHDYNTAMIFLECGCGRGIGYASEGKCTYEGEAVCVVKVEVGAKL